MSGKVARMMPLQWSSASVGLLSIIPRVHGRAWKRKIHKALFYETIVLGLEIISLPVGKGILTYPIQVHAIG